jgi:hypothetical protein
VSCVSCVSCRACRACRSDSCGRVDVEPADRLRRQPVVLG